MKQHMELIASISIHPELVALQAKEATLITVNTVIEATKFLDERVAYWQEVMKEVETVGDAVQYINDISEQSR